MQFIDLATQQQKIKQTMEANIHTVLEHGKYIMGPEVKALEDKLGAHVGVKHAVGCASGTDALLVALMAYGVGPGDAIFTSPFTFVATAEVISLVGATPVFVDIDKTTFNLVPKKLEAAIEAAANQDPSLHPLPQKALALRPKGIIGVDLFGLPADYDTINAMAKKHGLFVIEDAAQSFGAVHEGKKACSLANVGCTSFFPAKPLGGYGDGGMCFTDDGALADSMRSLRIHGKGSDKYDNVRVGLNSRLDTLQAAILLAKFDIFPKEMDLRQEVAQRYTEILASNPALIVPEIPAGYVSAWAQYSVMAQSEEHRKACQDALKAEGIPTAIYYPIPLHLQKAFADLGYTEGDFPMSEACSRRIFSLPMHPYLEKADQERIGDVLQKVAGY